MKITSRPLKVDGHIQAPASKSAAQRAIAIASLAEGNSWIMKPGEADDVMAAIAICRTMGATIRQEGEDLNITGGLEPPTNPLHCRESGLSVRMFAGIASIFDEEIEMTGHGSLLNRPMEVVATSLQALGVRCQTTSGKLPFSIQGPLKGGQVDIDGSMSSQVLTGILIAAPFARNELCLHVSHLKSKPYIDLTMDIMKTFGVETTNEDYQRFTVPARQTYRACRFTVEGDWSGAAFLLVAGAIAGEVTVTNLHADSSQGDKRVIEALHAAGARVEWRADGFVASKSSLHAFSFDATDCPDLFPPLVSLATHCEGTSQITGVSRLRAKESDRAATLRDVFARMGIDIWLEQDTMFVKGGQPKAATVSSHGDHRIAMAAAVTALNGEGPVSIEQAEAVNKSYPGFFNELANSTHP